MPALPASRFSCAQARVADTIDFKLLERLPTKNPDSLRELLHEVEQPVDRRLGELGCYTVFLLLRVLRLCWACCRHCRCRCCACKWGHVFRPALLAVNCNCCLLLARQVHQLLLLTSLALISALLQPATSHRSTPRTRRL